MKKLIGLILGLTLCLSAAMAESIPSKTLADLTQFSLKVENQLGAENLYMMPMSDALMSILPDYQERMEICQAGIDELAAGAEAEEYFGEIKDAEGNPIALRGMLGGAEGKLNVYEFCPIVLNGFQENFGRVTATMMFATPYEKDEQVAVLIGVATVQADGTKTVEWTALEGTVMGADQNAAELPGRITVEFTPEILMDIQNGIALLAVVSK